MMTDTMRALIAEAKRQNPPPVIENLTKDEFCARFKAHMLKRAGPVFDDGESIAEYADDTAPTYWDDYGKPMLETPEECADADMSYWEE